MSNPTIPEPRLTPDHWDHPKPGVVHVGSPGDGETYDGEDEAR